MKDFRVQVDNMTYGVGARGLIIVDNKLLTMYNGNYYYVPGGAIEINEITTDAIIREVKEELGIDIEVDKLTFIVENFFEQSHMSYHNIEWYYICHTTDDIPHIASEDGDSVQVVLIPLDCLKEYNIRPSFLQDKLLHVNQPISHVINKGI